VRRVTEREIQTVHGAFRLIAYIEKPSGTAHLALVRGRAERTRKRWCGCTSRFRCSISRDVGDHALVVGGGGARCDRGSGKGVIVLLNAPRAAAT